MDLLSIHAYTATTLVALKLLAIAHVRKRYLSVSLKHSLIQVTFGGTIVALTGVLVGNA